MLWQCEVAGDVGESGAVVMWVFEKSTAKPKHDGSCGITGCEQDDTDFFSDLNLDHSLYVKCLRLKDLEHLHGRDPEMILIHSTSTISLLRVMTIYHLSRGCFCKTWKI